MDRIVVVVPAHNEASRLPQCLASIDRARHAAPVPVEVIVVLDACTDGSRDGLDLADTVVAIDDRNVGMARSVGFASSRNTSPETWFATTDADCTVGREWLRGHWDHARQGARVVCGTVQVDDWTHLGERVRRRYEAGYARRSGRQHHHIHGANLGVAARDYWSIGGFNALPTREDVDLVDRLGRAGVPITWASNLPVSTSARLHGRAHGGFADHLRKLHLDAAS
ncbi:glycosyltransferase [Antrihabitans stalactiti]|uniref:4,4'-diaponeurosporenoate glycosyltransferase n=1 Tax=Antrihabitans stalactiti TaxID=2584121 RepID=A0A848KC74_9NOCA|nr:glycosyltransferase [Antrihabitans stalactiti]NMN93720.1 glycosyltransferase [Antrihabitans stalactiti]